MIHRFSISFVEVEKRQSFETMLYEIIPGQDAFVDNLLEEESEGVNLFMTSAQDVWSFSNSDLSSC